MKLVYFYSSVGVVAHARVTKVRVTTSELSGATLPSEKKITGMWSSSIFSYTPPALLSLGAVQSGGRHSEPQSFVIVEISAILAVSLLYATFFAKSRRNFGIFIYTDPCVKWNM